MGKESSPSDPNAGKVDANGIVYSTFKYCGDTKRVSTSSTNDGLVIVTVENLDNEGDGESSVVIYPQDLE